MKFNVKLDGAGAGEEPEVKDEPEASGVKPEEGGGATGGTGSLPAKRPRIRIPGGDVPVGGDAGAGVDDSGDGASNASTVAPGGGVSSGGVDSSGGAIDSPTVAKPVGAPSLSFGGRRGVGGAGAGALASEVDFGALGDSLDDEGSFEGDFDSLEGEDFADEAESFDGDFGDFESVEEGYSGDFEGDFTVETDADGLEEPALTMLEAVSVGPKDDWKSQLGDLLEDDEDYSPVAGGMAGASLEEESSSFVNPLLEDDEDDEEASFDGSFTPVAPVSPPEEKVVRLPGKPKLTGRDAEVREARREAEAERAQRDLKPVSSTPDELDAQVGLGKKLTYEVSVDEGGREAAAKKAPKPKAEPRVEPATVVKPVDMEGRERWVARRDAGRLSPNQLGVFKNLNRAKGREDGDELLREIFSRAEEGGKSPEEVRRRKQLANRAVFGTTAVAAGTRARFTEKDRDVLRFLGMFKYANARHVSRIQGVKEDTMLKRLYRLGERGLVSKMELYGAKPLWFLTEAGVICSGLELPRVKESGITFSMLPHSFVINHVAGNLWGGGVNVLALEDFPDNFRVSESGDFVLGESLVSEFQIQSSFASAKSANHKADVYRPAITEAMNREFRRWKQAGGVEFGPSPEQVRGNEYMWTLFPPLALKLAYHVPDLVVSRPRDEDGKPQSIAVEVELANKPLAAYERALQAYRYDSLIYGKVVWVVKSRGAARKIQEAARKLGLWDEGRVGIVPIYTEDGVFKSKAVWTI